MNALLSISSFLSMPNKAEKPMSINIFVAQIKTFAIYSATTRDTRIAIRNRIQVKLERVVSKDTHYWRNNRRRREL